MVFSYEQWSLYEYLTIAVIFITLLGWFVAASIFDISALTALLFALISILIASTISISRMQVKQLENTLQHFNKIEVIQGQLSYGPYVFPDQNELGIDYRKIYIGGQEIKLYHSGYLPSDKCFRGFYNSDNYLASQTIRLYIHWHEYSVDDYNTMQKVLTPCIVKIDLLQQTNDLVVSSR